MGIGAAGVADDAEHGFVGRLITQASHGGVHEQQERIVEIKRLNAILNEVHPQVALLDVGQLVKEHVAKVARAEREGEISRHDDYRLEQAAYDGFRHFLGDPQLHIAVNPHPFATVGENVLHQEIGHRRAIDPPAGCRGTTHQSAAGDKDTDQPDYEHSPLPRRPQWSLPYPSRGGL